MDFSLHSRRATQAGLRWIAGFEAAKGLLVLVVAFGFLRYANHDLKAMIKDVLLQLHLNPDRHWFGAIRRALDGLDNYNARWVAIGAAGYASLRFVEAYGLWRKRPWGEWVALISTGLFIPVEIYEILRGFTWIKLGITAANIALFAFVALAFRQQRAEIAARGKD